jgi:hypothetical protein
MKTTFEEIIEIVLEHEGGYVNDPDDAGGETKYGIAKRWYPDVDIKNLTKEQAKKIYHTDYWRIGPATLKAIQNISVDRVRAYRVLRFANIVIDKPRQEKFWLGWFRRAIEV